MKASDFVKLFVRRRLIPSLVLVGLVAVPISASFGDAPAASVVHPLPWWSSLVVLLVLADFAAISAMGKPYLSTFVHLSATPIPHRTITARFDIDGMLLLAETLACLDEERRSIWLRPRGSIRFRYIGFVVQFTTDESGRHITGQAVRYSSGAVAAALFILLSFLATIGTAPDARSQLAVLFLLAAIVAAVWYVTIPKLGRRMEQLARDALDELTGAEASAV